MKKDKNKCDLETIERWRRLNGLYKDRTIEEEVNRLLINEREISHDIKVCIGTDSQIKGKWSYQA
jgi:hypothetical protein